ncbi:glycosyltransferase [Candidatus Dojkabacteria bacterium]|nr:glycosyltransferase [Candidatus Dojkabacteria bacterium]
MEKKVMKKITVLEAVSGLGIGGIERAAQTYAQNLNKKWFNVIVGSLHSGPREKQLLSEGIQVTCLPSSEQMEEFIKEHRIDVVHAHCMGPRFCSVSVPVLNTAVFSTDFLRKEYINLYISKTLFTKVNSGSPLEYGKDAAVLYYPQDTKRWYAHIISKKKRTRIRQIFGFSEKNLVLGRVARSEPSKWDYLVLKTVPLLQQRYPNIRFVFVGMPLLYRKYLEFFADPKKIVFLPETSSDKDLAMFYQIIDIFWHAAHNGETFGNVNTEAMLFEKPVITMSTPFHSSRDHNRDNAQIEIVDHLKTGIVASYPSSVIRAINFFICRPDKVRQFGQNAKKKVLQLYDSRKVTKQLEKMIVSKIQCDKVITRKYSSTEYIPSANEVRAYVTKEYAKRETNNFDDISHINKMVYGLKHRCFLLITFIYLVARFIFRKIAQIDIENLKDRLVQPFNQFP